MDKPEFFVRSGPFSLSELARLTTADFKGDSSRLISGVAAIEHAGPQDITFLSDRRMKDRLALSKAGAAFMRVGDVSFAPAHMMPLVVKDPAYAFALAIGLFFPAAKKPTAFTTEAGQSALAHIDATARLEAEVIVEARAVIGAGAEIGAQTIIAPGAVIGAGVRIGRDCYIGPNAVVQHALVGNRVFIHGGAMIGQDGFGYVMSARGHEKIPQIGRVVIQDNVEIGAGTAIDRGALDDTMIGEGTKIDNQCQIGHNVVIGRHCVIAAKVGISGSCHLGDFVVLGGAVGLADHVTIGTGAQIGARSGVSGQVPAGQKWIGYPAKPFKAFFREVAVLKKLAAQHNRPGAAKEAEFGDDE